MIQFTVILPLAISGLVGAAWREYRHRRKHQTAMIHQPDNNENLFAPLLVIQKPVESVFDDCAEIDHYQRISFYSLALSLPAAWFYAPALWISIPLLSYSSYGLFRTFQYSSQKSRQSALTVFELASISVTLLTGKWVMASVSFALSFGMRNIVLQAGNVAHLGLHEAMYHEVAKVWVLRDGVEIEIMLTDLSKKDEIIVQAGELIIIEGTVHEGNGIVSQFSLINTIKSVSKQKDDKVFPFTHLESGRLLLRKC